MVIMKAFPKHKEYKEGKKFKKNLLPSLKSFSFHFIARLTKADRF